MGMAAYKIEPYQNGWGVSHDGKTTGPYETKEAAFEATAAAASLALREGHALQISAPGAEVGATADIIKSLAAGEIR